MVWDIILKIGEKITGIIDKAVPDKTEANRLKAVIQQKLMEGDFAEVAKLIEARAQIVAAEAAGHSWLQRNWRPMTMMVFVFIIFNNYVLFPYANLLGVPFPQLDLPPYLWETIKIGLGGYVFGRSGEQMIKAWKQKVG